MKLRVAKKTKNAILDENGNLVALVCNAFRRNKKQSEQLALDLVNAYNKVQMEEIDKNQFKVFNLLRSTFDDVAIGGSNGDRLTSSLYRDLLELDIENQIDNNLATQITTKFSELVELIKKTV